MIQVIEPRLEPPEYEARVPCTECGGEISGDWGGKYGDKLLCPDCLEEEWKALSVPEKFELLGYKAEYFREVY